MSVIDSIFHHRGRGAFGAKAGNAREIARPAAPAVDAPASPCDCCGGTRHEPIATRRGLTLRRCRDCGDVFVFPVPAQRAAPQSGAIDPPPDAALVMDNMLIRHGIASGKFLEIGVGVGAGDKPTLATMSRLNWAVTGV